MPDFGKALKQNEGMRRKTLPPVIIGGGYYVNLIGLVESSTIQ